LPIITATGLLRVKSSCISKPVSGFSGPGSGVGVGFGVGVGGGSGVGEGIGGGVGSPEGKGTDVGSGVGSGGASYSCQALVENKTTPTIKTRVNVV